MSVDEHRRTLRHVLTFTLALGAAFAVGLAYTAAWETSAGDAASSRVALLLIERSPALWSEGQLWRAVTSLFVHVSATHALSTGGALVWWFAWASAGGRAADAWHRGAAGLGVAVCCNAALAGVSDTSSVGASLWLAVLVGGSFARARRASPGRHLVEAALGSALLLSASLSPLADHTAHVAGLIVGFGVTLACESLSTTHRRSPDASDELGPRVAPGRALPATVAAVVIGALCWSGLYVVRCTRSSEALSACVAPLAAGESARSEVE